MSEPRVGLVVEGPTDAIVIEAALRAILGGPFVLKVLQPEPIPGAVSGDAGPSGGGWGGVYRWCRQQAGQLDEDGVNASLAGYDAIIVHVDADVAGVTYESAKVAGPTPSDLPCDRPCPPASATVGLLERVVLEWLGPLTAPPRILCIPSKCIEAWVVAAQCGASVPPAPVLQDIECDLGLVQRLHAGPARARLVVLKDGRFRKRPERYRAVAPLVTRSWDSVERWCSQAAVFGAVVREILRPA